MKPVIKWLGGKRALVERIEKALEGPCVGTYLEPFFGGGAVFFDLADRGLIRTAILSDSNPDLISFYKVLQHSPHDVLTELGKLPHDEAWKEQYDWQRDVFNGRRRHDARKAALLLWLNRTCFNGVWRVNRKGDFNVPKGSYRVPSFPTGEELLRASQLLGRAQVRCSSFVSTLSMSRDPTDKIYADPPYFPISETANFTSYTKAGFTMADHLRLALTLHSRKEDGARVVASNADLEFVHTLYGGLGFSVECLKAKRSVGAKSKSRKRVGEVLVMG